MSARAVVLTYHAIEAGPPPLCIDPALFREHLDVICDAPVRPVTLESLREGLGRGEPAVAITFDDGFASVIDRAAPMLAERGLPATVFCVAAHLGGQNDWPTEPERSPRRPLAGADQLKDVVSAGQIAVGSHGMTHLPLGLADEAALQRELVSSRAVLEDAVGSAVDWFAYPASSLPGGEARELVERSYAGAVAGGNRAAGAGADPWAIPRVDAHYLRRPAVLRRVLDGGDAYLALRRAGGRARRLLRRDYLKP